MAIELEDGDSFNGSIGNGNSETVIVDITKANRAELLIDDGTTGNAPATYDYEVELYSTAVDDYMEATSNTALTSNNPTIPETNGQKMRVRITNSSGGSATYRISLESFKEI